MAEFGFGPCSREEAYVYGAQRPGFPGKFVQNQLVDQWTGFMHKQEINRVICLLPAEELAYYPTITGGLLQAYVEAFGEGSVLWAPTKDRSLLSGEAVKHICYFLFEARNSGQKTVIHCSAGLGRTGQALAAWLVFYHNLSERKAIRTVEELNRSPMEAVFHRNAAEADLLKVLGVARELEKPSP